MARRSEVIVKLNKLPEIGSGLRKRIAEETKNAALAIEAEEKRLITEQDAVDTGFMRGSVQAQPTDSDLIWVIGNAAEYSPMVNYGTSKMPARPFVEPALDTVAPQYQANIKKILNDA